MPDSQIELPGHVTCVFCSRVIPRDTEGRTYITRVRNLVDYDSAIGELQQMHEQDQPIEELLNAPICERCYRHCDGCDERFRNRVGYSGFCGTCDECHSCCEDCNEMCHIDALIESGNSLICSSCYEERLRRETDDECDDDQSVHSYGYKPIPLYLSYNRDIPGSDFPNYGIELEVERETPYACMESLLSTLQNVSDKTVNDYRLFYLKHDGSLIDGVEIVTHPINRMTLLTRELWQWTDDIRSTGNWTSYKQATCGLHIHVSREPTRRANNVRTWRIARLVYCTGLFKALSRRHGNFEHCSFGFDKVSTIRSKAKGYCNKRYEAINVTPRETTEFRFWRGTLRTCDILGMLECTVALVEFSRRMEFKKENSPTLENFLTFLFTGNYPYAVAYVRKVYQYHEDYYNLTQLQSAILNREGN